MTKKKILSLIIAGVFALSSAVVFTGCGSGDEEQTGDDQTASQQAEADAEAEQLASKAEELNKDEANFYGTWEATSANAEYLYGHLTITINEDGTFEADVTDEHFTGTWEKIDGGIAYKSDLINGKFFYGKKCRMVIEEDGEDEDLRVTLVKVEE